MHLKNHGKLFPHCRKLMSVSLAFIVKRVLKLFCFKVIEDVSPLQKPLNLNLTHLIPR